MWHQEKDTLNLLGKYSREQDKSKNTPNEDKTIIKEKIIYRDMGKFNSRREPNYEKIDLDNYEYASFIDRVIASVIDGIIIFFPLMLIESSFILNTGNLFSSSLFFEIIIPCLITILFWTQKGATPGKMIMNMMVIDNMTKEKMTVGQSIIRYIGYFPSMLVLGLGLLWVAIDERNQGWHDKIANTIVIKKRKSYNIE